jgi:acetyl-CoA acetyltransferase
MVASAFAGQVAIAGIGYSEIGRRTGRTEGSLGLEAVLAAIADAGLSPQDVEGVTAYPDRVYGRAFEGPSITYVQRALNMRRTLFWQAMGWGPGQFAAIVSAAYAIAAGAADVVVCYRAHGRQETNFNARTDDVSTAKDDLAFRSPYGVPAGAPRLAMWATRHMFEYGTTEDDLCAVVLNNRENAQLNPRAAWHGSPLTREDYYASPVISSPFRVLDCDMPVDGAVALVLVSTRRFGSDTGPGGKPLVKIESMAEATGPDLDWDQWADQTEMASRYVGEQLWAQSSIARSDVDCVQAYDGFSWLALCWMEDLGFVAKGAAGEFFRSGRGRVIGGDLPTCTDGGQLGGGRLHGFGKLAESVTQLRGEAGERQVAGASVAVACAGGGPIGAALILNT